MKWWWLLTWTTQSTGWVPPQVAEGGSRNPKGTQGVDDELDASATHEPM